MAPNMDNAEKSSPPEAQKSTMSNSADPPPADQTPTTSTSSNTEPGVPAPPDVMLNVHPKKANANADPNVMSLSRRACYKCGELGHHADACPSAHRLCYNCKQPNHESSECPLPRTTESKQCYHCQGLGHVQADCPTLRLTGAGTTGRCHNCGQIGHYMRACPNPPQTGLGRGGGPGIRGGGFYNRGGFNGGLPDRRPATCYKCGGPNHFARDCQAQAMKCYSCGKLGHISRDCTAPNGGPLDRAGKTCYQCGQPGHISRECPQKAENINGGEHKPEGDLNGGPGPSGPAPI